MTDHTGKERKTTVQIAGVWLLCNALQAAFSPLTEDEAYYWMYSNAPDWGYFDHPPMIVAFILAGRWLGGELGVRAASVAAQVGALLLLWSTAKAQWPGAHRPSLFFALAFSLIIFQAFGFVATPDAPLLFFAAAFLFVYRRFARQPNWPDTFLLGALSAALLYSKYHGVLLIGFTVLSNPALLRNKRLYVAGFTGLLLFFPHLWWQYANDFPSFRYHLLERTQHFKWWYVAEFLLNVFLLYNPLLWPPALRALRRAGWNDPFARALGANFCGFLLFFLFSTLRGHVQPQWTVIASIPMLLMVYGDTFTDPRRARYIFRVALLTLPLALAVRLMLILQWTPVPNQFFRPRVFTEKVEELAKGRPVAFSRSYQQASLYAFYSGDKTTFSAGTYKSRRSQFDLWDQEARMHLKPVLWIGGQSHPEKNFFVSGRDTFTYTEIDTFYAFYKVQPVADPLPELVAAGEMVNTRLSLGNPYFHTLDLDAIPAVQIMACWMQGKSLAAFVPVQCRLPALPAGGAAVAVGEFTVPDNLPPGRYRVGFAFQYKDITPFPVGNWHELTLSVPK